MADLTEGGDSHLAAEARKRVGHPTAAVSFWPLALLTNLTGDYAGIATLAVGAALGWALPTIAGFAIVFVAHLTGLVIGLTAIVAGLALVYSIFAAAAGGRRFPVLVSVNCPASDATERQRVKDGSL